MPPGRRANLIHGSRPVNGDTLAEGDETFFLNLGGATNVALADNQATATIFDDDPLPALSVGNVTAIEGNGAKTFSFAVTLSVASTQTVTVQVTTADGTASAGSDYITRTEQVTFAPGQTSKTVNITVSGDAALEPTENFLVQLSAPTGAVLADAQGVGTIQNDDTSIRVSDVTLAEGDDGTTTALFAVTLTGALSADAVTVNYATAGSSAAAGGDFIVTSGTLVFAPGETMQTVAVVVVGDTISENNETFLLNVTGAVNAVIADSQGIATIVDPSDPLPSLVIDDAFVAEGPSGTRNLTFTARLSAPSGKTVTVNYASADSTASAGSDYTARTGTLSFIPGATAATISIVVPGDTTPEMDETLYVNLQGAVNATIPDSRGIGTIRDDDSLIVDDAAVSEGDAGTTVLRFTIRLLVPRAEPVTLDYASAGGTAAAGADYLPVAGTVTFAPGETAKIVDVRVVGDRLDEANQTLFLNLSKATGAILADTQAAAAISDDDPLPGLTISDGLIVAERNSGTKTVTFTVRLSEPSGQNVTVQYATADGTASAGSDYIARTGTLTIGAGQTVGTIAITINGDMAVEGNESFTLLVSNPVNAVLAAPQATATIIDDEVLGSGPASVASTTTTSGAAAAPAWTPREPRKVADQAEPKRSKQSSNPPHAARWRRRGANRGQ